MEKKDKDGYNISEVFNRINKLETENKKIIKKLIY